MFDIGFLQVTISLPKELTTQQMLLRRQFIGKVLDPMYYLNKEVDELKSKPWSSEIASQLRTLADRRIDLKLAELHLREQLENWWVKVEEYRSGPAHTEAIAAHDKVRGEIADKLCAIGYYVAAPEDPFCLLQSHVDAHPKCREARAGVELVRNCDLLPARAANRKEMEKLEAELTAMQNKALAAVA